ncbi:MAG: hypothetical protein M3443_21320, partial [Actinomycetota bacterium]|nr:hypothetical protein [Actinomycetota bacterium]
MSTPTPAAHRLTLTAAEFSHLVDRLDVDLPPDWRPATDIGAGSEVALLDKGVLQGSGDLVKVHPSIEANVRIIAGPQIMFDTTATCGSKGSRSLHVISGALGASLFLLPDAGVELSMFSSVDLGRELVRAVPEPDDTAIESTLDSAE